MKTQVTESEYQIIGQQFGLLTVVEVKREYTKDRTRLFAYVDCACGTKGHRLLVQSLKVGHSKSCGCDRHGKPIHGDCDSVEYGVWRNIIDRCTNRRGGAWKDYGGRGITVCDKWRHDYPAFLRDVGRRPSPAHSIDRFPNNDGNYEPGNVRWATRAEQNRNMRNNKFLTINGETLCVVDWAKKIGMSAATLRYRLKCGMLPSDAIQPESLRQKGEDGRWIQMIQS